MENREWVDVYVDGSGGVERVPDELYFVYGAAQDATNIRPEYLSSALQISDITESTVLLLNPDVRTTEGEWEAWFFAAWAAGGAYRYRSFWELMCAMVRQFKTVETHWEHD